MYSVPVSALFLLWSHGFSMCSLQISVLFVLMRVEISLFSSRMLGCCGVFLLVHNKNIFNAIFLDNIDILLFIFNN